MPDIYKYAAQNTLRFESIRGDLDTEQLFDLPLTSKSGFDLDSIARNINKKLKDSGEESFVDPAKPRNTALEVSLEILKDVITTKQKANSEELARKHRTEERRRLLDALANKKDQLLTTKSVEELEAQLAALDE